MNATPQPDALPLDVRLTNALATTLFYVAAGLILGGGLVLAARLPLFDIRTVSVTGDVAHYNAITLRANVMPHLHGTFFTLDLNTVRQQFESVPWVRQALVRREFPNRLKVQLQEHQAVAFWGEDDDMRLVNSFGEVFEANLGEIEQDNLPRLLGPDGQSARVLAMHQALQPLFETMDLTLDQLELTGRGGWRGQVDNRIALELGSGEVAELTARVQRFLTTVTEVAARYQRRPNQLASADLRHKDGYAIRMDGVSTLTGDEVKKK